MGDISENLGFAAVSGMYTRSDFVSSMTGFQKQVVETVRFDVDGWFHQMMISGTYSRGHYGMGGTVDWIANRLTEKSPGVWEGEIVRRWRDSYVIPHTSVRVQVPRQIFSVSGSKMTLTFTGGAADVTRVFDFESPYFRTVEVEFDTVETAARVTSVDTWAHPNRPVSLRREQLDIVQVYSRVGVDIQQSPNTSVVGLEAGIGAEVWSDQQLHDAMQMFWSRYKPRSQWALWMLFARRHVNPRLGGIMFDHKDRKTPSDPIQRQGAAIFADKLADNVPPGETHPTQWIRRERFFAAIHEMGHCFNLLHSDEKLLGIPWAFDPGDPMAESFMNYPSKVNNFYSSFDYRFDDQEISFIRHAPEEFVKMGGSAFGQNHEYAAGRFTGNRSLGLALTVDRTRRVFEFLEPISVQLKLANVSGHAQIVDTAMLEELDGLVLLVQPGEGLARQWRPYARRCTFEGTKLLHPGETLTASVFASAGLDGWHMAEPGRYGLRQPSHQQRIHCGRAADPPHRIP